MNTWQHILLSVSALGACNGIILGTYLIFNRKGRPQWTFFLGLLLLMISIRVAKSVLFYFNSSLPKEFLQAGLSACFFIGPALYYMLLSARKPASPIPVSWKITWGVLLAVVFIGGAIVSYPAYPDIWNRVIVYIIYAQWLIYLLASVLLIRSEITGIISGKAHQLEKQLLAVLAGNIILYFFYASALMRWLPAATYIAAAVSFTIILFVTIFIFFYSNSTKPGNREPKRKLPDAEAQPLLDKLTAAMAPEVFKDANLKLGDLARRIHTSPHQLSALLNDNLGKSFSAFINEYRIAEACRLIVANDHLSLEAIGYEVGFNSKSTFYTAFRKVTGTTPAIYREKMGEVPLDKGPGL